MLEKSSPYSPDLIIDAKKAMKKDCYFLMPNIYSKEFCEEIKSNIDNINSNVGVEINYGGTETRIWSAQKRFDAVKRFFDESSEAEKHIIRLAVDYPRARRSQSDNADPNAHATFAAVFCDWRMQLLQGL